MCRWPLGSAGRDIAASWDEMSWCQRRLQAATSSSSRPIKQKKKSTEEQNKKKSVLKQPLYIPLTN